MPTITEVQHCRCTIAPQECWYCGHRHHVHRYQENYQFCLKCGNPFSTYIISEAEYDELAKKIVEAMYNKIPRSFWPDGHR